MDCKKTNCHSTFLYPLSYQSLITMVLQRLISSYKGGKKKRIFFGPHLPNPKDIYFFIEELLTTVILHPIGSLKVYEDLTSVADQFTACYKGNKQIRKQQALDIFSECSSSRKQKNHFSCTAVCPNTDL